MSELIVITFDDESSAKRQRNALENKVKITESVIVLKDEKGKVKIKSDKPTKDVLKGGGIGILVGALIGGPVAGALIGGAVGGLIGIEKTSKSIDQKFIKDVGESIQPGTAALFLTVEESDVDELLEEVKETSREIFIASLPGDPVEYPTPPKKKEDSKEDN